MKTVAPVNGRPPGADHDLACWPSRTTPTEVSDPPCSPIPPWPDPIRSGHFPYKNSPRIQRSSHQANADNGHWKPLERGFQSYTPVHHHPKSRRSSPQQHSVPKGPSIDSFACAVIDMQFLSLSIPTPSSSSPPDKRFSEAFTHSHPKANTTKTEEELDYYGLDDLFAKPLRPLSQDCCLCLEDNIVQSNLVGNLTDPTPLDQNPAPVPPCGFSVPDGRLHRVARPELTRTQQQHTNLSKSLHAATPEESPIPSVQVNRHPDSLPQAHPAPQPKQQHLPVSCDGRNAAHAKLLSA